MQHITTQLDLHSTHTKIHQITLIKETHWQSGHSGQQCKNPTASICPYILLTFFNNVG